MAEKKQNKNVDGETPVEERPRLNTPAVDEPVS